MPGGRDRLEWIALWCVPRRYPITCDPDLHHFSWVCLSFQFLRREFLIHTIFKAFLLPFELLSSDCVKSLSISVVPNSSIVNIRLLSNPIKLSHISFILLIRE